VTQFLNAIVAGILVGSLYGLFSSGLTLIFGITRIVNFAHGDFVTIGMYLAILVSVHFGIAPLYMTVPVGLAMMGLGYSLYRTVLYRTVVRDITATQAQNSQMVLTLAISIIIVNALQAILTANGRTSKPTLTDTYKVGGIFLGESRLVAFGVSVVIFVLLLLLIKRTTFGKAVRATVDDREMATMVGIKTQRIYALTFGIGILLAGVTGAILATYYTAVPTTGENFMILGFVIVVLGGLGSIEGAFISGIIVGVLEQLTATYVALDLEDVGIFLVFVVVLLVRPSGLFGSRVNA
jgi:branched-chain amino acid transport system permease protein